ncbi:hypothetical protein [Paenibacillus sp. GCM10027626]|uniref:hypothetical protein n=1 Tax=Paenibacillus sp. GCM10027626 TaxID=3273411 RepID=UPI003639CAB8
MEKRLARTELLFSIGFLFTLVLAVGAFFYGIKVGSDKTEAKFIEQTKHLSSNSGASALAYQQQDLVSFYHTVYLPYREFQNAWVQTMTKLAAGQLADPAAALKELSGLADRKYTEASRAAQPQSSPLLGQAQVELMKGMKALGTAADQVKNNANRTKSSSVLNTINNNQHYNEGVKHILTGQMKYYTSMQKWSSSVNRDIPDQYEVKNILQISAWKKLPLTVKNKLAAEQIKARNQLTAFLPHDLTARIDEFILSGQASKMKIKTIDAIIDLLISTKAVRAGDFGNSKARLYDNELLPQLPFFYPEQE